jgi:hypothetical protein
MEVEARGAKLGHRNAEMNARSHEANPTVQVNLNKDRRVTISLTVNSSITNLLAKWTHDCRSVGVSVAWTIVFLLPKEMRSATAVDVCIKENETDCVEMVVLYEK